MYPVPGARKLCEKRGTQKKKKKTRQERKRKNENETFILSKYGAPRGISRRFFERRIVPNEATHIARCISDIVSFENFALVPSFSFYSVGRV